MKSKNFSQLAKFNLIISTFLLLTPLALAQSQQDLSIQITGGGNITLTTPSTITFPTTFSSTEAKTIQKILDPRQSSQVIKVNDTRNNGDFSVDARISDMNDEGGDNTLRHDNFKIVTVNTTSGATVDIVTNPGNDYSDVTGPIGTSWDFVSPIPSNQFTSIPYSGEVESLPIIIINGINLEIVGRIGEFTNALGLELTIPASQAAGNYTTTLTITLNT